MRSVNPFGVQMKLHAPFLRWFAGRLGRGRVSSSPRPPFFDSLLFLCSPRPCQMALEALEEIRQQMVCGGDAAVALAFACCL